MSTAFSGVNTNLAAYRFFILTLIISLSSAFVSESVSAQKEKSDATAPTNNSTDQDSNETESEPLETKSFKPVPPKDISEMVKEIGRLSGADFNVEVVGGKLIFKGNEQDRRKIDDLIRVIEQSKESLEVKLVRVKQKDANEIAQTLQPALRAALKRPNTEEDDELTLTAVSSSLIVVSSLPEQMDFIVDVIAEVDEAEDDIGKAEKMTFVIKNRRATDVAEKLGEILDQIQAQRGIEESKRIKIYPNNTNNSIMIVAPQSEYEKIEGFISELDVKPDKEWGEVKLTLFPLLRSKADDLQSTLEELISSQSNQDNTEEVIFRLQMSKIDPQSGEMTELPAIDLEKPIQIETHEGTNSLIVATVESNIVPMGELIKLLDGVKLEDDMQVRLYPIRYADAEELSSTITDMFENSQELTEELDSVDVGGAPGNIEGKALVYNINIQVDKRTNTIIAAGRLEQLSLIDRVVSELDQPVKLTKFPLQLVKVNYTDASRVASMIQDLLDKRMENLEATAPGTVAVEKDRIYLNVDVRTNSLLIAGSDENVTELKTILNQLDKPATDSFETIRIVECGALLASDLKEKFDELWQRKASIRSELELPEDSPVIVADELNNVLVVASSVEDYSEMKKLVSTLNSQPLTNDTRLFSLSNADANELSTKLDDLFQGISEDRDSFNPPTIIPDARTNTLIVTATPEAMSRVDNLVAKLDVPAGTRSASLQVYALRHASVITLQQKVQEVFDSQQQSGQGGEETPAVVLSDETSNSLIVSASSDDQDTVVQLLGILDRPSKLHEQVEIFPLQQARAQGMEETLTEMFESQSSGTTGSGGRIDAISVRADQRTNSLIVWASPSQMDNVRQMIEKLDRSETGPRRMVKIIQLKRALAEDFAALLEETLISEGSGDDEESVIVEFLKQYEDGSSEIKKLIRQDIKIKPDTRTNSLMVWAPPASMEMLEELIQTYDKIEPVNSELRLFPLINSDADAMVEQLTDLFNTDGGGGGAEDAQSQIVLGDEISGDLDNARVGQELRFAADIRTNTLIAAGAEVDLVMVEELVRYLDAQDVNDRITEVIPTRFKPAQDIADVIQNFNQQEQDIYGELDNETSQLRRAERQISVESIGDEQGGSMLVVGVDRRNHQRVMEMIRSLDRDEPQVSISVLIAEVTLTDDIELGVELAGQELDFSRTAVLGPNGIIEGPDFDIVAGTSLGAIGSGQGFNFTVSGEDFSFLLHALQQESRLEILSRPLVTVRNGEEGKITIADQIPIVESTNLSDSGSVNTTVGREEVGIVLTAIPQISPDGYVTIDVVQEISNFSGETFQIAEGVIQPTFTQRIVDTNVTVRDGETVVIGGLITSRDSEGVSKVPVFGDLPYLGALFRTTSKSTIKTELLVAMTVDVLTSDEDVRNMSIEQRDKFVLPDSIRTSPLMEGLRIKPDDSAMGPKNGKDSNGDYGKDEKVNPADDPRRKQYGPRPKIYGPILSQPTSTTAKAKLKKAKPSIMVPTYGPTMADAAIKEDEHLEGSN